MKKFIFSCLVLALAMALFSYGNVFAKDTLVIAVRQEPSSLDPAKQWDEYSMNICSSIYNTLCRFTPQGKLVADLALSWKNIDGNTIQVKLRKGVKFHNGESFNAKAVKFSIDRELDEKTNCPRRSVLIGQIKAVEVVNDYTVNIITSGPRPMAMPWLTMTFMVPPEHTAKNDLAARPIGTGPYKFVSASKTTDVVVLTANDKYFTKGPAIKQAIIKAVADSAQRVDMLLSGEADIITDVDPQLGLKVQMHPNLRIIKHPGGGVGYLQIQTEGDTPLSNKKFRQALNYAVDKEALIKHMKKGNGRIMAQPAGIGCFGYNPKIKPYAYDPKKAQQLLKESGYTKDTEIIVWGPTHYDGGEKFPLAIKKYFEDIGINVKLEYKRKELQPGETISGWKDILTKTSSHQMPQNTLRISGWGFDIMDASNIMDEYLVAGNQSCYFNHKELTSLLVKAQAEMDVKKREKLLQKANQIAHDEAAWVYLWHIVSSYGINKDVSLIPRPAGFVFAHEVTVR